MEFNVDLLLGIFIIFYVPCNFPFADAMIGINVRQANPGEFPFVVSITNYNEETPRPAQDHICTGAVITKLHILSAAHCFENRLYNNTVALVGTTSLTWGRIHRIQWWISYEQWIELRRRRLRYLSNDIGIIRLIRILDNDIVPGLVSPIKPAELYDIQTTVVGWGASNNGQVSTNLLTAHVKFISNAECRHRLAEQEGHVVILHTRYMCTKGFPFVILSKGDMGGPVVFENMIIGVNKETLPLPDERFNEERINIHTGLESYTDFFLHVTKFSFEWQ